MLSKFMPKEVSTAVEGAIPTEGVPLFVVALASLEYEELPLPEEQPAGLVSPRSESEQIPDPEATADGEQFPAVGLTSELEQLLRPVERLSKIDTDE